ncbi:MAG: pyridoxal phosphate-dependent aminotransferase [Candidatus Aminicenantia bacterium]
MSVAERIYKISLSPTLKIMSKAKAMKAEGIDMVDLSVGEPDFPTPENVKEAAKKAIDDNFTKYTVTEGILELKKAIIRRLKEDHQLNYLPEEIIVSTGAKSVLYHLVLALINEGEEVIIPAPYWVSYPEVVTLAKGKAVIIPAKEENGFLITLEQLKAAISPNTKALILNNPANPTGACYSRDDLENIADIILEEDIYLISDEIYEKLVYDDFRFCSFASLWEEVKKRTILINGVSKAYSMTGWRVGYAAGPAEIIEGMARIQSHSISHACSISQKASIEALNGPQYEVSKMVAEFQRRRNYVFSRLQTIPGISCLKPKGAFYLFPNISSFYEKEYNGMQIRNSYGMAYYLLKQAKVAIVPGDAFGADNYIRISYATSMENLEKGMDRIIEALSKLKPARKVKRIALNNTITRVKKSVPIESNISFEMRNALVAEVEENLSYDNYYEWNANINGVVVQLRTNVSHLYDFWIENWYPAQLEADLEPHGVIYAIEGIPGREPRTFYNSETKTGILINCDGYWPLRSLALGLVTDAAERLFNAHAVRGMSADIEGRGLLFLGPPGTKKTEHFYQFLQLDKVRLHSSEVLFIRYGSDTVIADSVERKFFIPTNTVESYPKFAPLFDRSKCENVVTRKEECKDAECLRQDNCRLDRGSPYCYKASKEAYAMLDPYWLGGLKKHIKRTDIHWVLILRYDPTSPILEELEIEDAVRLLESGQTPGLAHQLSTLKIQPFFNPHLLLKASDRVELQKEFFHQLFSGTKFYLFNTAGGTFDEVQTRLKEIVFGKPR